MGRNNRDLAVAMKLAEAVPRYVPTHVSGSTLLDLWRPQRAIEGAQD